MRAAAGNLKPFLSFFFGENMPTPQGRFRVRAGPIHYAKKFLTGFACCVCFFPHSRPRLRTLLCLTQISLSSNDVPSVCSGFFLCVFVCVIGFCMRGGWATDGSSMAIRHYIRLIFILFSGFFIILMR